MTETISYQNVDKSDWPRGPWDNEPDKLQWQDVATGLPCLIVRGPMGALCGYVGVSPGHPWYGQSYDDVRRADGEDVAIHGGLTYSGGCKHSPDPAFGVCHIPAPGQPDDVWWHGFDCGHAWDLIPWRPGTLAGAMRGIFDFVDSIVQAQNGRFRDEHGETYRDLAFVQAECVSLARQAREAAQ